MQAETKFYLAAFNTLMKVILMMRLFLKRKSNFQDFY